MTRFQKLAIVTTVATFALVVLGGTVRVTGSGLGCGRDWPRCNGRWLPPLEVRPIIEYSHRTVAAVVGTLVLIMAVAAWRRYRRQRAVFVPAMASLAVLLAQVELGRRTVDADLSPAMVSAHLAT